MPVSWQKENITLENGCCVSAIAPELISASRATDIPAFYSTWFFEALEKGYCTWQNPFNRQTQYVSFRNLSAIVFWTKNPAPIISKLPILDEKSIGYYFLYTLNNYAPEQYERNVQPLHKRIETFIQLSSLLGKERVIWRFDPFLLSGKIPLPELFERIGTIGQALCTYTDKLVFSFIDILKYSKVNRNLSNCDKSIREFTLEEKYEMAQFLQQQCQIWQKSNPNFSIASCAQEIELEQFGIRHNKCIDDNLLAKLFPKNQRLLKFLGYEHSLFGLQQTHPMKKDLGQRNACGCIISKDIGRYDTCPHGCFYCYANSSPEKAKTYYAHTKSLNP